MPNPSEPFHYGHSLFAFDLCPQLFWLITPNVILIKNGGVKGLSLPEKWVQIVAQWQTPSLAWKEMHTDIAQVVPARPEPGRAKKKTQSEHFKRCGGLFGEERMKSTLKYSCILKLVDQIFKFYLDLQSNWLTNPLAPQLQCLLSLICWNYVDRANCWEITMC